MVRREVLSAHLTDTEVIVVEAAAEARRESSKCSS